MSWLSKLTENLDKLGDTAVSKMASIPSYNERLKQTNPEAYAQLEKLMSYSANEAFGGKPQDWQAQIFTNLDTSKLDAPKKIDTGKYVDTPVYYYDEWLGQIPAGTQKQWQTGETPKGFTPSYELVQMGELAPEQRLNGYTKDLGMVNGLPVVANYDIEGNLTGYDAPTEGYRNWINGKQSVSGRWDAEGKATPRQFAGGGGGFFGNLLADLGPIAPIALAFALPGAGAAIGSALGTSAAVGTGLASAGLGALQGASGEDLLKGAALGTIGGAIGSNVAGLTDNAALGQIAGGTTSGLLSGKDFESSLAGAALNTGTQQLAQNILSTPVAATPLPTTDNYSVNADYSISAPASSGLGLKATLAPLDMSNPYSFDTTLAATGGLGLNLNRAASAGNIEAMGGGQGLLGNIGEGKTLSEIGSAYKNLLTNTITGNPLGEELANITTGAEAYSTNPNDLTDTSSKALSNLLGKLLMATTANTSGTGATATQNPFASLFGGLLGGAGSLYQGSTNQEANKALAEQLRQAGQTAQQQSMFRPVGTTTRFGTSNFTIDPTTGQLTAAGYTAAPEITQAQTRLMGLGAGYLSKTPEEAAQEYLAKQYDLLAPSRERQLAELRNRQFQTGRGGLSVGATGVRPGGGLGLQATNPEMEAYYNALAQQDAELAAKAMQAGQQQIGFGAGLFGTAGQLEQLAQQPLGLSTDLARISQAANANAARLGLSGNLGAAEAMRAANTYNPTASVLSGLGTSPLATSALGTLFGNTALGKSLSSFLSGTGGDYFTGSPEGVNFGNITLEDIAKYASANPYENFLNPDETWMGE